MFFLFTKAISTHKTRTVSFYSLLSLALALLHTHTYDLSITHSLLHVLLRQRVKEDLTLERFYPAVAPECPELVVHFDEHILRNQFKVGLIYQSQGQTSEEQLFGNQGQSEAFLEFMELIGKRVRLKEHEG